MYEWYDRRAIQAGQSRQMVMHEWRAIQSGQLCQMVMQDPCRMSMPHLVPMPEAWLCACLAIAGHGEPGPNFVQCVGAPLNTDH
jgi:hypothetical protein